MQNSSLSNYEARLVELQKRFVKRWPERLAKIEEGHRAAISNDLSQILILDEARRCAHEIVGSASTFSFPEIEPVARKIEDGFVEIIKEVADPSPTILTQMKINIEELRKIAEHSFISV